MADGATGLTAAEAAARLQARGPAEPPPSRSTATIVRANVLTPFNVILLSLGLVTLGFGDARDALFLGIVVANAGIGIAQELRARRKLDELAALVAPHAVVVRDGEERDIAADEVVEGDLVRLAAGDQVVADGELTAATGLELDESILTGESRSVRRQLGDEVRSGSFAVEGVGAYVVRAVGTASYAERLVGEAREFRHPRSPLERAIDRLLYILVGAMVPLGIMLVTVLWKQDVGVRHAVQTAVAGLVTLVPEGLVLLLSVTYAAAALALARRGALVQQLSAIESLASVDTLCVDKTGTLTSHALRVVELVPADRVDPSAWHDALGRYAASAPRRNPTLEAIAQATTAVPEEPVETVPFSSRRRWSGLRLGDVRYVLGAPELFPLAELEAEVAEWQEHGRRVVALGTTTARFPDDPDGAGPPPVVPLGLVVLGEELRADARETIDFLRAEGIAVKVLSGDAPETVGSIAADAGLPLTSVHDGRELPSDPAALATFVRDAGVIGRISPEGKQAVVEALQRDGRYVAMLGDGVNDVPALKSARLGIAQGSGAQLTKAIADIVLVSGDFASVPRMVASGRQILRNIRRVTTLFVAKSVFAAFLILSIGLTPTEYPLLPRHLTIAATLTVGIPSFFLALAPSEGPWTTRGFLREVGRFSVPAGVAAGLGVLATYLVTLNVLDQGLREARTAALTTLIAVGLYLVLALEATGVRRAAWVGILCASLGAVYIAILALPGFRSFFDLAVLGFASWLVAIVGAGLSIGFLWLTDDRFVPLRRAG
ncbi:MAG TPA: HAD-IC family P-type ATPase [Gaiellaceae bacterium]|nr:HAD-IC family P-type ATPase [Gaiellaceae bacterium]